MSLDIINLPKIIDCIKQIFLETKGNIIIAGIGNPNIIVDSLAPRVIDKCKAYDMPDYLFPKIKDITPDNLDSAIKYFSSTREKLLVIDSAIGNNIGEIHILDSPATISALNNTRCIGDYSVLITTIDDTNFISTLNVIYLSDILSYAISRAYSDYLEEKSSQYFLDFVVS